jgi:hypothetical protein
VRDGHLRREELLHGVRVAADLALRRLRGASETKFIRRARLTVQKNSVYAPTGITERASSRATPASTRRSYVSKAWS